MERVFRCGERQMNFVALRSGRLADGLAEDAGVTLWLQRLLFIARRKTLCKKLVQLCPTLRLDVMSLSVECVLQASNHKTCV